MVSVPEGMESPATVLAVGRTLSRVTGYVDRKSRPPSWFAEGIDEAVVLLNRPVHRGQTKSGSFTDAFSGKERFEDMGKRFLVHTISGIAYGNPHILPGYRPGMSGTVFLA